MDAPQPFEWRPAGASGWRCVELLSDLHLSAALPKTTAAFLRHLATTPADAVLILGDLFEVWVGDDARHGDWEAALVAAIAAAAKRVPIAFMVGNRDFLVGAELLHDAGMTALPDPTLLELFGERLLLSHGDALCLADVPYQQFRRLVRSASWQQEFLAKPLAERRAIAAAIRSESRSRRSFDGEMSADLDADTSRAWLDAASATTLLHGHTHRPAEHALGPRHRRVVLSDWDLDNAQRPRAELLRWSAEGLTRLPLADVSDAAAAR